MNFQKHQSRSRNTNNSPMQYEEFRQAFDFFDANHDGYVTTDELEQAMSKCGVYPSKLELRLVMTQGDADGNDRSRYDKRQLWQQFKLFDRDNDGFIELDEMFQIVKELSLGRYFPREIVDKLFREADVDGDGKISFDGEFWFLIVER
ncbi:hypothetical protein M3Y94_00355100 [Aphelenchoides besseyi]|nr:hypothetical protein M3Y94_00355100 [Aphelenchoides besseyi]